jgi:hypothetical protein
MYASNLEEALYHLMAKADVAHADPAEFRERMESLRRYGRLPHGRKNHATLLTDEQIADAIFGLTTPKPKWAGHAAIVLRNLKPVGGTDASFAGAVTLSKAIEALLASEEARGRLIALTLTTAEHGTNADGHASVRYKDEQGEKTAYFVHQLAVSLHDGGAEKTYDPGKWLTPSARQLVLGRGYFDKLADQVESVRRLRPVPSSDGSEYDAEEAEEKRLKALGVQKGSRYLTKGVDNQVFWPRKETLVTFDRYTLVLFPKTKEHVQSISIDLTENKLSLKEASTVINRFLSVLTWCDDQFAVAHEGSAGSPIPGPVGRRDLAFAATFNWTFDRKIPSSDEGRRALAYYREARNAEQNFLVSFAVLSYYKIIEILYPNEGEATDWLRRNFVSASADIRVDVLKRFNTERGIAEPEDHINRAYRIAVAHARPRKTQPSDPDCSAELQRLHTAAEVLRPLARYFIAHELAISDSRFSGE